MRKKRITIPEGQFCFPGFIDATFLGVEQIHMPSVEEIIISATVSHELLLHPPEEENTELPGISTCTEESQDYFPKVPVPAERCLEQRIDRNIAALKAIQSAKAFGTGMSKSDREIIAAYTGWEAVAPSKKAQDALTQKLESVFTQELVGDIQAAPQYPYVFEAWATQTVYTALAKMGFSHGTLLCMGCGNGDFLRAMPEEMRNRSEISAEATDVVSQDILTLLYPSVKTYGKDEEIPSSLFDAVIGVIPVSPEDKPVLKFKGQAGAFDRYAYHLAKAICALRTGGIMAVLIPSKVTDSMSKKLSPFELSGSPLFFVGGVRLDWEAAGNGKSYDLLCFQKQSKKSTVKDEVFALDSILIPRMVPTVYGDKVTLSLPTYFSWNPETVIGEYLYGDGKTYPGECVLLPPACEHDNAITDAIDHWNCKDIYVPISVDGASEDAVIRPADPSVKNYRMVIADGSVWQRIDSAMIRQKLAGIRLERVMGMICIRDAALELIHLQFTDCSDEVLAASQMKLSALYDPFVKKFGHLTEHTNAHLFREDADYAVLASLEYVDEEDVIHKADIFTKRTIQLRPPVTSCETPDEALLVCLDQRASVDIDFIAKLCSISPAEVIQALEGRLIFRNPVGNLMNDEWLSHDNYLSGNIHNKLKDARTAALTDSRFEANVAALENVVPPLIPFSEIHVNLGAPYIPADVIKSFIFEEIGKMKMPPTESSIKVERNNHDKWAIEISYAILPTDPYYHNEYGTEKYRATWILEHLLNNTALVATKKEKNADGVSSTVKDPEMTLMICEKAQIIKEAFAKWLSRHPDKQSAISALYNETYNNSVIPHYDGSHLTFPGMTACIQLDPHQKDAVYRIICNNGAYIAHVVGAGKTFTLLTAGMELKRLGRINKPLYVVPNNLISQWVGELQRLYPAASILAADPDDMHGHRRKRMLARMATGAYDAIIMGGSSFINLPPPYSAVQRAIEERKVCIQQSSFSTGRYSSFAETEASNAHEESTVFFNRCMRESYTLADLGVDFLLVDEAHEYKNLGARSSFGDVKGLPNTRSSKCLDMFYKTKYMSSLHGGKGGFVFASGTPYSNSIVEMYTVLRYYDEKLLIDSGIFTLDQWLSIYAQITDEWEIPPEGLAEDGAGLRQVRRVSGFANLPELMAQALQFMDVVGRDDLKNIDIPTPIRKTIVAPPSLKQKEYMESLVERANTIRRHNHRKSPGTRANSSDNMLLITVDGRKCALDSRMVDCTAGAFKEGKLNQCANQIKEHYSKYDVIKGTQLVFCEMAASSHSNFNAYVELKKLLVEKGIPEQEIAFAHEFDTPSKKRQMRIKMQCGKLRVLIGSTKSLGQGVNVQNRLIALHHLDVPWVPKDLEQREGRILRRGNMHSTVYIHSYVTEGSFDAYMWQLIETKARLIAQVMRGDHMQRTLEDTDTKVLSYSEIKAIATGNTAFLERAKIEGELMKLSTLKRNYDASMEDLRQNVYCNLPAAITSLQALIPKMESDITLFEKNKKTPTIVVGGIKYSLCQEERGEICKSLDTALRFGKDGDVLGSFLDFDMVLTKQAGWSFFSQSATIVLQRNASHKLEDYSVTGGRSGLDCCIKICRVMQGELKKKQELLSSNETALRAAQSMLNEKFEYEDRINELKSELERLTKEIAKCA